MANPYRGEVAIVIEGQTRIMRLTLGSLAELETRLGSDSLSEMIRRFETGDFRVRDLICLITAGLNGGGWKVSEEELLQLNIEGGPVAVARAAAHLLKVTFTLPGEGDVE